MFDELIGKSGLSPERVTTDRFGAIADSHLALCASCGNYRDQVEKTGESAHRCQQTQDASSTPPEPPDELMDSYRDVMGGAGESD